MGAGHSGELSEEQLRNDAGGAHLTAEQVHRLVAIFKDHNKKAKPLSRKKFLKLAAKCGEEFPNQPMFKDEPHLLYLFSLFDVDHDGLVGIEELIAGVSVLCAGNPEEKARLTFHAMDLQNKGYLTQDDIKAHLQKVMALVTQEIETDIKQDMAEQGHTTGGFAVKMLLKGVMFGVRKGMEQDTLAKILEADTDNDGKIQEGDWMEAAKNNETIQQFINPDQLVATYTEKAKESM